MCRSAWRFLSLMALASLPVFLLGCGGAPSFTAKLEPWRGDEESACMASGTVRASPFIRTHAALGGPSVCGTARPFEMAAAMGGRVTLKPAALLRCPMIPQVERWITQVVAPAARYHYGAPLAEISVAGSYSCRPMNHVDGARLSEHGYANAIDVSGFTMVDGQTVSVKRDWNGNPRDQAFLRDVHQGSCRFFTTVLSPNYDRNHRDHFHLDLARHGREGLKRICK
jgi:hypothetical protein